MALVSRWDIRDESYADAASVTSLTDLAGATNLTNNCGASFPTYSAASDAMVFSADACAIGSASLAAPLSSVPTGSAWSIFCLVNESSFGAGMFCGFGNGTDNTRGVLIRDDATGAVTALVRDSSATNNAPTTSGTRSTSTWYVVGLVYDGTNIVVSIDGASTGSTTRTANIAADAWNQFAIGAFFRDNIGVHANGLYREIRVYNSNETANYATIGASMLAGGGPATNPVLDAENSSFALTVQDATLTWSWGNYYTVEPGTSNTTVGESIFGGLTINAGSRIIGPNSIGGLAATWEISGGNATGRVTLTGGPLASPVAVSIPYYNGSTWDTISVTFIDEGDVTTSIDAEYASFALTVQDVTLRATRIITAEYASFSYTAQDVTLGQTGWAVSADFAAFVYGAQAVTLTWSGAPVVAPPAGNTEFRGTVTSTILRSTITPWGRDFRNGT
jgi:hypothetical protein